VQSFLADIPSRVDRTRDWRENGAGYVEGYGGKPETLAGLTVDREKHTIDFPPGVQDWQMSTAKSTVFPETAPQTGAQTRYRARWIGGILDLYKSSATRIIFIQIPRAPWPGPEAPVPARFLQSVAGHERLTVMPAATFEGLECPDLFADGLHLNSTGRGVFSRMLAGKVAEVMEPR